MTWVPRAFAVADLALVAVIAAALAALPVRWWPVDAGGALLAAALGVAAFGVWRRARWARPALAVALAIGMALVTALCLGGAFVAGVQGVFGKGAALGYVVLIVPVATWLVLFPAAQLAWLSGRA